MNRASQGSVFPAAASKQQLGIASLAGATSDPLFIIGTGRCGSTLFHDLLTRHPHVSFMTSLANRHPTKPIYNRTCVSCMHIGGRTLRRKYFPVEAYNFWDHHYRGFSRPFRDLLATDACPKTAQRLRAATQQFVTPRRPRMIFKITGWPRIGFLQAIYPQARFISVIRDGRAVANSLLNVRFWDGWLGPNRWSWGSLDAQRDARWHRHGRSFVALAALQWDILMEAYEQAKTSMPDPTQLLEIRYENLCSDPLSAFRRAAEFAELEFSGDFARAITAARLSDANDKWREDLTADQQSILTDCLSSSLLHWGYEAQRGPGYTNLNPPVGRATLQPAIGPSAASMS